MKDFLIELDVCLNEGEELRELSELMGEYDVEVYDIDPEGPAGGNPCITFQGPEENLLKLGAYLLDDDDEGFIRESMRPKEK